MSGGHPAPLSLPVGRWAQPAQVSDPTDGRIMRLAGLNLSRALTLSGVESALAPAEPRRAVLAAAARAHEAAGLKQVYSGHYGGEHWLATFAVLLVTNTGI